MSVYVSCMAPAIKQAVADNCDLKDRRQVKKQLSHVPACSDGALLQVSSGDSGSGKRSRSSGQKRAPSKYNLFIQQCLPKESGPFPGRMKKCAAKYKYSKGGYGKGWS